MMLFAFVWIVLVAAAGGLAVGAIRGRELRSGCCAVRGEAGGLSAACQSCPSADPDPGRCRAERSGGM